jgi:CRP-like cAMP-binding protein
MAYSYASVVRTASSPEAQSQPIDPLITRLASHYPLTEEQERILASLQGPARHLPPRTQFGYVGGRARSAYAIREGWAFGYSLLASGERQVIGFLLPGDIVGLGGLSRMNGACGLETITETVITEVSLASVRNAARQWPEIYELFFRHQGEMQAALVGQIVDLGRRDSRARVARLLLKLERRLMTIGQTDADGYDCPISQYLIADALGLTSIHVNRVLRALREEKVVTVRKDRVTIHDRARLSEIAGDEEIDGADNVVAMNSGIALVHGGPRFT